MPTADVDPVKAGVLRERANNLLREAVEAGEAGLWGETIRQAMVDAAMLLHTEATQLEGGPLEPHDVGRWTAFLPTVRVGGSLPVTFRADGPFIVVEMIVPYEPPAPHSSEPEMKLLIDNFVGGRIPLAIAPAFPVPVAARYRMPPFDPETAARFLRQIVRSIYVHEIDEQFRVGETRPFAPEHVS
jgi:hypothetical protein